MLINRNRGPKWPQEGKRVKISLYFREFPVMRKDFLFLLADSFLTGF